MKIEDFTIEKYGGKVWIDSYGENFPKGTIASIDLETNGKELNDPDFRIVCIGINDDGINSHVFYQLKPQLFSYLKKIQIVAHNGSHADIPWLNQYFGIRIDQLYFDTKIGSYVFDSSRKNFALKPLLKDYLNVEYPEYDGIISDPDLVATACDNYPDLMIQKKKGLVAPKEVTLDYIPKEVVAQYNACDTFWTFRLWKYLESQFTVAQKNFFENIEMPMNRLLYHSEQIGVQVDKKAILRIHKETSKARRKAKKEVFEILGQKINLNSPKQLLPVLREQGLKVDSTGEGVLISYKHLPLVKSLLDYRGYQKICSTYTIPLYFNANADNRVYAKFNQNTITGRLSSSDPINLQNQPPEVRECFVAKEGHSFVNADWSNIELRLPAHFSGESKFIEELTKQDGDLHSLTGNFLFKTDIKVLSKEKFKEKRAIAKTCNFLLTNSGTSHRLAAELECTQQEANSLFRSFWEGYPILAQWLRHEKLQARIKGGVTTWFGRWVSIPQLKLGCNMPWKCGKDKNENGYVLRCKNCIVREEAERSAMSVRIQGTAADMCKLAALRLFNEFGYVPNLLVHDELNYEIPDSQVEEAKKNIKQVMESVALLKVPLIVEIGVAKNWKEVKGK